MARFIIGRRRRRSFQPGTDVRPTLRDYVIARSLIITIRALVVSITALVVRTIPRRRGGQVHHGGLERVVKRGNVLVVVVGATGWRPRTVVVAVARACAMSAIIPAAYARRSAIATNGFGCHVDRSFVRDRFSH